jgi:hypothetical protein
MSETNDKCGNCGLTLAAHRSIEMEMHTCGNPNCACNHTYVPSVTVDEPKMCKACDHPRNLHSHGDEWCVAEGCKCNWEEANTPQVDETVEAIKLPVRYDKRKKAIFDADKKHICSMSWLEKHPTAVGQQIANALNRDNDLRRTLGELVEAVEKAKSEMHYRMVNGNASRAFAQALDVVRGYTEAALSKAKAIDKEVG